MRHVFLDTVGLLAIWNQSDQWHEAAQDAFNRLCQDRAPLLTTTFVLLECGNAAARKPIRHAVDRFRERLEASNLLVTPTGADWRDAWSGYRAGPVGGAGIVDHVSFVVMRRLGLTSVFSNDAHFREVGFELLF